MTAEQITAMEEIIAWARLNAIGVDRIPNDAAELFAKKSLYLAGVQCTTDTVMPEAFSQLTNLTSFWVYSSNISAIPATIGNLVHVTQIGMSDSAVSILPDSITDLLDLQLLYIYNTAISELPVNIGNLDKLETLYMTDTEISVLPASFENLVGLRKLTLTERTFPGGIPEYIHVIPEVVIT